MDIVITAAPLAYGGNDLLGGNNLHGGTQVHIASGECTTDIGCEHRIRHKELSLVNRQGSFEKISSPIK